MSLEQAILDRLEKRNAQIEMLQQTIQAMSHTADAEREHTRQQLGPLIEENKKLAAQIESDENVSQLNREHAQYQIASLTAEVAKLRAEVPLESTREGLKNAVAKLQEVTTEKDRMQSKYESLLAKTTDLGSYAMTLGRKEGEPLEMFMERQALRLAALESKAGPSIETLSAELSVRYAEIAELHKWATGLIESPAFAHYHYERVQEYNAIVARINSRPQLDLTATLPTVDWQVVARNLERTIAGLNAKVAELEAAITAAKCDELAKATAKIKPLEALYKTLKGYQDSDSIIGHGTIIEVAIDKATEALSQLTA